MNAHDSMDSEQQNLEQRMRRLADTMGLMLVKSRSRHPDAEDRGLYVLVEDTAGNGIGQRGGQAAVSEFAGGGGMTLREVEQHLTAQSDSR